jgi:large subunit ribosomal protein L13
MKTFVTKPADADAARRWYIVNAEGQTLGRLASHIAAILKGKHKPIYSPSVDCGDYVVVINAEKIAVTGRRMEQKHYHRHSGYPGGLTSISLQHQLEQYPHRVLQAAVKGMLPKNVLGRQMLTKMKVYSGNTHPHQAQQPVVMEL